MTLLLVPRCIEGTQAKNGHSDEQIKNLTLRKRINILAPAIVPESHMPICFSSLQKTRFCESSCDEKITDITAGMKLDRYKTHDIEIVIDRLAVTNDDDTNDWTESIKTAMYHGENVMMVLEHENDDVHFIVEPNVSDNRNFVSKPEPNLFSLIPPKGVRQLVNRTVYEINCKKIIPDPALQKVE
jgi:excinuclease ABC subunit A